MSTVLAAVLEAFRRVWATFVHLLSTVHLPSTGAGRVLDVMDWSVRAVVAVLVLVAVLAAYRLVRTVVEVLRLLAGGARLFRRRPAR